MTPPVPAAVVQIVREALREATGKPYVLPTATAVAAALARAGVLDPDARLRAELDAARAALQSQKTAANRVILEIADERDQARRERAAAHAAIAALRAKTDQHGGVPWLEPELGAVFAALDAAPAETDQEAPTDA